MSSASVSPGALTEELTGVQTARDLGFPEFPSFVDYLGRKQGLPNGETFRERATEVYFQPGSAGVTSRNDWRNREFQSVECRISLALDHTFLAAKAFQRNDAQQVRCNIRL
jgi:hypothetical protein